METDTLMSDGNGELSFKHKFSLAGFGDGHDTLSITARDDNHAVTGITLGFTVDDAAPEPPLVVFGTNGSETWAKMAATVVTVTDTGGGVDASSLKYVWSDNPVPPAPGAGWKSFDSGDTLTLEGTNGDWYLHIRAEDTSGNPANVSSNRFRLDATSPQIHFAPDGNTTPSQRRKAP